VTEINGWLPDVLHQTHPRAPEITRDFICRRRNDNTRAAYLRVLKEFLLWVERAEFPTLAALTTSHVSDYIKGLSRRRKTYKQAEPLSNRSRAQVVACLRGYFDDLVRGGALPSSPGSAVETYALNVKIGHYQALKPHQMGEFIDSIEPETLRDLQERAMIALMGFSCARVGAVVKMKQEDVYEEDGHLYVRLHEKRDNRHYVPCHPELEGYLREFLARSWKPSDECDPNPAGWLFRRWDKERKVLTGRPISRFVCYHMVKRRNVEVGLPQVTNHTFRATGITAFLEAGGALDDARRLANHASVNTTKLYDHRKEKVSMKDVQMINYGRKRRESS
jgi:site-specific recombinase XerD